MAKKTTLTVTTEFGTFTRTTARTYTHLVVANGHSEAFICAYNLRAIQELKDELRYLRAQLAGTTTRGRDWQAAGNPPLTDAQLQERLNRNQDKLDRMEGGLDLDEALAVSLAAPFEALGWNGRLDLARKEAAKFTSMFRAVRIIDVATGKAVA